MKCLYHRGDLDGKCSAAIVKLAHPECEMIGVEYGEPFPWDCIKQGEDVVMVDFCLEPFADMIRLSLVARLTWIDHHKSGIEARDRAAPVQQDTTELPPLESYPLSPYIRGIQIVGQAACELAWNYFFPDDPAPLAVHLLGRYDVWDHSDPRTLQFQYGLRCLETELLPEYEEDMACWKVLFYDPSMESMNHLIYTGSAVLAYEQQTSQRYLQEFAWQGRLVTTAGEVLPFCVLCLNRGLSSSMAFATDDSVADLYATYVQIPDGRIKVSLYRHEEWRLRSCRCNDVAALAEMFGGGGHAGAAGFVCDELPFVRGWDDAAVNGGAGLDEAEGGGCGRG